MPHAHPLNPSRRLDPALDRACVPLQAVTAMTRGRLTLRAGELVITANARLRALYTLEEGWALRYRTLPNGSRQILDFILPGDWVGLPSVFFGSSRCWVRALTPVTLGVLDARLLPALLRKHPNVGWALLKAGMLEQERADTRLTLLGRLGSSERIGYLLLELPDRLPARG